MPEPSHPEEIEDAHGAALVLDSLSTDDISRFTVEVDSLTIEGTVDYWNSDDQMSYRYKIRFEVNLSAGNCWLHYRKDPYGSPARLPEDWTEIYSKKRRR